MGSVEEFMRFHHLPKILRDSIRAYYRKTWHKNIYFNDSAINNELSYDLRRDVALFLKKSVVSKVSELTASGFKRKQLTQMHTVTHCCLATLCTWTSVGS
jgi:hypothetical protein